MTNPVADSLIGSVEVLTEHAVRCIQMERGIAVREAIITVLLQRIADLRVEAGDEEADAMNPVERMGCVEIASLADMAQSGCPIVDLSTLYIITDGEREVLVVRAI